jgi:hypothetical protein
MASAVRFPATEERHQVTIGSGASHGVDRFARDQTLDELAASIERDIGVNRQRRPSIACTRIE